MLTPLDIHNKVFGRAFRGYRMDEVDAFLDEIIRDFETHMREILELKETLARMGEEAAKNREIGATLEKTMVLAQKVYEEETLRANKEAEIILWDAETKGEKLVQEAHKEVLDTRQRIERLRLYEKQLYLKHKGFLEFQMELLDGYKDKEALLTEGDMDKLVHGARERDLLGEVDLDAGTIPDIVAPDIGVSETEIQDAAANPADRPYPYDQDPAVGITWGDTPGTETPEGAVWDAADVEARGETETAEAAAEGGATAGAEDVAEGAAMAGAEAGGGFGLGLDDGGARGFGRSEEVASPAEDPGFGGDEGNPGNTTGAENPAETGGAEGPLYAVVDGSLEGLEGGIPPEYAAIQADDTAVVTGGIEAATAGDAGETAQGSIAFGGAMKETPMAGIIMTDGFTVEAKMAGTDDNDKTPAGDSPFTVGDQVRSMEQVVLLAQKMEEALKALDTIYGTEDNEA